MNDPRLIREQPDHVKEMLTRRKCDIDFVTLARADANRREAQVKAD